MRDALFDVILYGGYGLGNLGDDALMVTFYRAIRKALPHGRIGITSARRAGDQYIETLTPDVIIIPRQPTVDTSVTCNLEIFGGGTQWYSFPGIVPADTVVSNPARVLRYLKRQGKRILQPIRRITSPGQLCSARRQNTVPPQGRLRISSGVQVAAGIGLGPFLMGGEDKSAEILAECSYVAVRDPVSYKYCQRWGIPNAFLRADICYIGEIYDLKSKYSDRRLGPQHRVGVVVRDWPHTLEGSLYSTPLRSAVTIMRKMGLKVSYFVFSKLRDEQWLQLLKDGHENPLIWQPESRGNISSFIENMADYDVIISARYHALVFAAVLGIPTIAIEVEPKLSIAAAALKPGCGLWRQPFDPEDLVMMVSQILDDYQTSVEAILLTAEAQRSLSTAMVNELELIVRQNT